MSATEYTPSMVTLIGCNKALSSLHTPPHTKTHATEDKPSVNWKLESPSVEDITSTSRSAIFQIT
jgi:hypothetical protein